MSTQWRKWLTGVGGPLLVPLAQTIAPNWAAGAEAAPTRVLIVVGPSKHPPGTHEVAAGARLIQSLLDHAQGVPPMAADVIYEWPKDKTILDGAATLVFTGDLFPGETLENSAEVMADLTDLMNRGRGMVCLHFATGLRQQHMKESEDHPLLRWTGGCFYKGVARVVTATLTPEPVDHPVLRGWREFTFEDEPYWNNYFGKDGPAPNVTPLVSSMLPPETPAKQIVAWAVERADGGRGVGMVVPHFYRNWGIENMRTLALNAICWTAKLDVPAEGVRTPRPDLAAFEPVSMEPQPRPKKTPPAAK
ncbi:MAG: ThuA domain-containing protein [Candidatus Sumerlaeota bacterium]|nr:ThuA domain-containing protein [Candidatus Sumerlaeota bacterium]